MRSRGGPSSVGQASPEQERRTQTWRGWPCEDAGRRQRPQAEERPQEEPALQIPDLGLNLRDGEGLRCWLSRPSVVSVMAAGGIEGRFALSGVAAHGSI